MQSHRPTRDIPSWTSILLTLSATHYNVRRSAGGIVLYLRWCARSGRDWRCGATDFGLFIVWLRHAGAAVSGLDPMPGAQVLAGPGARPVRSARRINAVLSAVRGFLAHAVSAGDAPAAVLPLLYDLADDRDLPSDRAACRVPCVARELHERWQRILGPDHPDTLTSGAVPAQPTAVIRATAYLTLALIYLGKHEQAHVVGDDALSRARRVLGSDRPVTLRLASSKIMLSTLGPIVPTLGLESSDTDQLDALRADTMRRSLRTLGPRPPRHLVGGCQHDARPGHSPRSSR